MTKWCVILSAEHERIRNTLRGKRIATVALLLRNDRAWKADCHTPYGGLACRLGRCFCFAEVSTGHPHRNDKGTIAAHLSVLAMTKLLDILNA